MYGKASGLIYHFRKRWLDDWFGLVDLNAEWFKEIWTDKELHVIKEITDELKSVKYEDSDGQVSLSENMKRLCKELNEEMNLQDEKN